jgi:hypothetical protein
MIQKEKGKEVKPETSKPSGQGGGRRNNMTVNTLSPLSLFFNESDNPQHATYHLCRAWV